MTKNKGWVIAGCLLLTQLVHADEINDERVLFVELERADCTANDGKLIALENVDPEKTMVVWADRWLMGVQTTDQVKYELLPRQEPTPLGCSMTKDGDQHWTVSSTEAVSP